MGTLYPLAVKSTQILDLAHQKERVALWCSWIQFPPFTGALLPSPNGGGKKTPLIHCAPLHADKRYGAKKAL